MAATEREIEDFAQYAKEQLRQGGERLSLDDLFDRWRFEHPAPEDILAVKASVRDMERGEVGRSLESFADEFRSRNDLPNAP